MNYKDFIIYKTYKDDILIELVVKNKLHYKLSNTTDSLNNIIIDDRIGLKEAYIIDKILRFNIEELRCYCSPFILTKCLDTKLTRDIDISEYWQLL